jgi:2-iminobutanoate/2-iminopropanoate deaminase
MKKIIYTEKAPNPVGPYNQAILAGNTLYLSGQIAINAKTGELINTSIEEETKQVLNNLSYVLEAAGMRFENVVKCTVFVADMKQYATINQIYMSYFGEENAPARELVEVAALPKYVNVEISAIAVK